MRPLRLLLPLLLATAALAACGDAGDAGTTPTTAGASADAFPVTIENQLGPVEIPEQPKRVVAFDFDSADAAIALGVVPVGMAAVDYAPGRIQPWTKEALAGKRPELFTYADHAPFEQVAAMRPDVILATNTYGLEGDYDTLSRIAPVVAPEGDEGTDAWQTSTVRIGRALGREDAAKTLVADTQAAIRDARRSHPAFDRKTITFFNAYEGEAWAITRADASIRFLEQLGFVLTPEIAGLEGKQGRTPVGSERFDMLEADVLMGTSPTPGAMDDVSDTETFERLGVVERGGFVDLDLVTAASIAFPSALSVRYGLEQIVPRLAEAAGGDT